MLLSLFGVPFVVIVVCFRQLIKFQKVKQYFWGQFAFRVKTLCLEWMQAYKPLYKS